MGSTNWPCYDETIPLSGDCAPGGAIVYYADGDEEILYANQYVIDLFECESIDDFLELVGGSFRGFVYCEDLDFTIDSIWGQVKKCNNFDHVNYRIKTKTGKLITVEDYGLLVDNGGGRPVFYVFVIEVEQRGLVDWLTGLPSMVRFYGLAELGAKAIEDRGEMPVAVALDLMGLKAFNTQHGRAEGDRLLCVFADVLRRYFGSEACSRFGEDHFYAFASKRGFEQKMDALFEDFKNANDGRVLPVRAGACACDAKSDIVSIGFDRAKIACDLDRKTWRSHLVWFSDEMRAQERLRIHVLDNIDRAVAERWVRPHYQAIVRMSTGHVCGEEALARWIDPEYGALAPDAFVPVLEDAGLLQKLDMHMLDCVVADLVAKRDAGMTLVPVSVNMSLSDLGHIEIAEELARRADAAGISHRYLRVEFTESTASANLDLFNSQVKALHEAGFEVWMDDFGSGYSSLNTLRNYEFDLIKLDMEFIGGEGSEKAREIVAGVIRAAKKMGIGTLAEGIEGEQQALFLESIGCDMAQGFHYTKPLPLELIMRHYANGNSILREPIEEFDYWNEVGAIDLFEPLSDVEGRSADGTHLRDFPAGVVEKRDGRWRVLRANMPFRKFLDKSGIVPLEESNLQANPVENVIDHEYASAASRSVGSDAWERVSGRLEYGMGFQFYTRRAASTPGAEAFAIATVPSTLGVALGAYGDVPVAYAVLRVKLDDEGESVVDAEYVYGNPKYCDLVGYSETLLPGNSYSSLVGQESAQWFPYFFRAAVLKEEVHDVTFSPGVGHWLSFNVAPSPVADCCVFAFTIADAERLERKEIEIGRNTSDFIVRVADAFDKEESYDASMNAALEMMSHAIHPKRLFIFERGQDINRVTFEWCAEGAHSQMDKQQSVDPGHMAAWDSLAKGDSVIYIPDISVLKQTDEGLFLRLEREGIERLLAVPLRNGEETVGNLVAENYRLEEDVDVKRLLETVASFIGSRIINQRLVAELERTGAHDSLTGLLNRRGFDRAILDRMAIAPGEPYVLALMDIDNFKTINDLHGHDVGDEVLKMLARSITENLPDGVVVGRNGGDEFVAMLFGDDAANADEVLGKLAALDMTCMYRNRGYGFSISVGYVGWPDQAIHLNDAYTKADAALYAVKLANKASSMRYSRDVESQYRSQLGFTPRDIAENIPGAIMVHRAIGGGDILFANNGLVELFECDGLAEFMEFTGGTFAGAIHPDDAMRVHQELASQLNLDDVGGKNYANYRIVTKKGNVRHVAQNGHLVDVDEVGKVFYVLMVNIDERDSTSAFQSR